MAPQIDPETSTSSLAAAVHAAVITALQVNAPADATPADIDTLISSAEAALADYKTAVKKKSEAVVATMLARGETQRNAVESVDEILRDLSGMQRRARTEAAQARLGIDPNSFLDFNVAVFDAFLISIGVLAKVLAVVTLMTTVLYSFIAHLSGILAESSFEKSGEAQFGPNNYTVAELVANEDFEDALGNERNRNAAVVCALYASVFYAFFSVLLIVFHTITDIRVIVGGTVIMSVYAPTLYLLSKVGGVYLTNNIVSMIGIFLATMSAAATSLGIKMDHESESGAYLVRLAGKRAARLRIDGTNYRAASRRKLARVGALTTLPLFCILLTMALYPTLMFWAFSLYDNAGWTVLVTLTAFAVKVAGNKGMLTLVARQRPWAADATLFAYELVTATLLRVLQLSIPDEHVAQLMSLFGAVAEVCVRIFFYNRFTLVGMRAWAEGVEMTGKERFAYAKWGRLRVTDGTNDMIVEYVSSLSAAMFIVYLAPTGAFSFATTEVIETSVVVRLLVYQLVPELFMDFYVTFMEIQGGLRRLHELQWDMKAGGDEKSKFRANRWGDLVKSVSCKVAVSVCLTAFVLVATLK